ncbi:MAG TPA: hypothetical protein VHX42_00435 [Candidatus Babeliales bacterium]|jgi:hypothetical protein|nr:hypothetical protein [Candidatus Babeliales bacterium]
MIKSTKIIIVSLLLLTPNAYPIQRSTADMCTATVAALCTAGSYKIYLDAPYTIHPAILAGVSGIITATTYHFLHTITPAGRIKRANIFLDDIARHTLARVSFDGEQTFFDAVQDVYLTDDLPLISAYNHLINLVPVMHYTLSLINTASAEVGKDVFLQEECDASLSRANRLFKNISDAIKRIRDHKDYLSQLTIYKESLAQEKQTIAQQQMAHAQYDMAQAQQSSSFLKWFKFLFGYKK